MNELNDSGIDHEDALGGPEWLRWTLAAVLWAGVAIALHVILGRG